MPFDWNSIIGEPVPVPADHRGDIEKVSTAVSDTVSFLGVKIYSRYGKHHELAEMAEMIAALPPTLRAAIDCLWCDSKACCYFVVEMRRSKDTPAITKAVGKHLEVVARRVSGGHNGMNIGETTAFDPYWESDLWPEHEGEEDR